MLRILAVLALLSSGCAIFTSMTPGSNSDKGVWVAKTTNFFGIQFSDQEILYCSTASGQPACTKAGGDVHAVNVTGGSK